MPTLAAVPSDRIRTRILDNFSEVSRHADRADACLARGELAAAAIHASIAAQVAIQNHAGIYWSPRIESILNRIGRAIPDPDAPTEPAPVPKTFKRILHVFTQMRSVGGHTKMLAQWAKADPGRENSVVLTQHSGPVPQFIKDAFPERLHRLNHSPGGHIEWAKRLRKLARQHDAVVLHTHGDDPVATLAFSQPDRFPPVLLLNHADHLFWLGSSVCHLVINLRDAAQDLAMYRRGVAVERNILMPTLVEPIARTRSREEAKREIGVSPETTLIVSAARQVKYRTVGGVTFADMHAPVLKQFPGATLMVVGAGDPVDWAPARAMVEGQIIPLPEQGDPKVYFEAADIYVDSYPFVSSTSMMEAACYGLPLLTLFTGTNEGRILAINHVALVGTALLASSLDEYRAMLTQLLGDSEMRERCASAAQAGVQNEHQMPGWSRWLEGVYARAAGLPRLDNALMLASQESPRFGEPDCLIEDIFGGDYPPVKMLAGHVSSLPTAQRIIYWSELNRAGALPPMPKSLALLTPGWVRRYIKDGLLSRS